MNTEYDAIVVGARCGGSPTAMLLARAGHRVLLVDKATFPSDTMSTHLLHPPGVAALNRWGLLQRFRDTGCPPLPEYAFDYGSVTISGTPRAVDGHATAYGPRRTVLDMLLVDAAVEAGVEVREGFVVDEVLATEGRITGIRGHEKGGAPVTEHARVVIGADGKHSLVAKAAKARTYHESPPPAPVYYAYWSGLPIKRFEMHVRAEGGRGWAVVPTHRDLVCVAPAWPQSEFHANRNDLEGAYMRSFALAPEFAELMAGATRESRFVGTADLPGFLRQPYGPGWALVGDAGYHKHPVTAFGITDAFLDAEGVAAAIDDALSGRREHDDAMAEHQRARDERALPLFQLTCAHATLRPPSPDGRRLLEAIGTSREASDGYVSVMAGTLSPTEFFHPEKTGAILAEAG